MESEGVRFSERTCFRIASVMFGIVIAARSVAQPRPNRRNSIIARQWLLREDGGVMGGILGFTSSQSQFQPLVPLQIFDRVKNQQQGASLASRGAQPHPLLGRAPDHIYGWSSRGLESSMPGVKKARAVGYAATAMRAMLPQLNTKE
jgi:hypothetical protein